MDTATGGVDALEAVRRRVEALLYREAELLDEGRMEEWLALMAPDLRYVVPIVVTRERGADTTAPTRHFDDDYQTLRLRVQRLATEYAWAENPPSRTRHLVGNIQVAPGPRPNWFAVRSAFLLVRSRGTEAHPELLSGQRRDVWESREGDWLLHQREVILDQEVLGMRNLSIFF